jgi:hypothetical protein
MAVAFSTGNLATILRYLDDMELDGIVSEICDEADDFLAGVTRRDEAKAGISEFLTIRHSALSPLDRKAITEESMRILEQEGFFDRDAGEEA